MPASSSNHSVSLTLWSSGVAGFGNGTTADAEALLQYGPADPMDGNDQ